MRSCFFGLAVAAFGLLSAGRADANYVTNGGFETGDFTGWNLNVTPAILSTFGVTSYSPDVHSGHYAAYFNSGSANFATLLSQNLNTVAGATYTFSFWIANTSQYFDNSFSANWNGTPLLSQTNNYPYGYIEHSFTVQATSSRTTIEFGFFNGPGDFLLDDVSVSPLSSPSSSAVPEPASLTLAAFGIAGLLGATWRRRKLAAA